VTGFTHASHCATEPIYATVTDDYAQNSMPTIALTKIPWANYNSLSFPELKNSPQSLSTLNKSTLPTADFGNTSRIVTSYFKKHFLHNTWLEYCTLLKWEIQISEGLKYSITHYATLPHDTTLNVLFTTDNNIHCTRHISQRHWLSQFPTVFVWLNLQVTHLSHRWFTAIHWTGRDCSAHFVYNTVKYHHPRQARLL